METIDTSGYAHSSQYLLELINETIRACEEEFKCNVRSVITDKAMNVTKMRTQLAESTEVDVICYGCGAYILNLLAKNLEIAHIENNILRIMKYFRNTHLPKAYYKREVGKSLIIPSDIRWNKLLDCIEAYLNNWHVFICVCEENRNTIKQEIMADVQIFEIKTQAKEYQSIFKPIFIAFDYAKE